MRISLQLIRLLENCKLHSFFSLNATTLFFLQCFDWLTCFDPTNLNHASKLDILLKKLNLVYYLLYRRTVAPILQSHFQGSHRSLFSQPLFPYKNILGIVFYNICFRKRSSWNLIDKFNCKFLRKVVVFKNWLRKMWLGGNPAFQMNTQFAMK